VNKGTVKVVLGDIERYGMPLDKLEQMIASAKQRAATENIRNIVIDIDYERGYYDSVDITAQIVGTRDETDEEFELRKRDIEQRQQMNEQQERQAYERLKAKFGSES
jgi:hypothetical protein